jgi:hypothetical protein
MKTTVRHRRPTARRGDLPFEKEVGPSGRDRLAKEQALMQAALELFAAKRTGDDHARNCRQGALCGRAIAVVVV